MSSNSLAKSDLRYKDVFQEYLDKGWQPIPLPHKTKTPPPKNVTGKPGVFDRDKILDPSTGWLQDPQHANGNVAIRAYGILGVDVDAYDNKQGDIQLDMIEAELDAVLPPTYYSTSRGPMGKYQHSGIRYYRVPTHLHFISEASTDIDLVQETYRYAVVWPSIHPPKKSGDSDMQYRWYDADSNECGIPAVEDLPELPQVFIDAWSDGPVSSRAFSGVEIDASSVDMEEFTQGLSEGEPSQYLLDKMPEDWEAGRFATVNKSLWILARLAVFSPDEPGLGNLFVRILNARKNSSDALTPVDQRINHLRRSLQRAVAWQKEERDAIPDSLMEWASSIKSRMVAQEDADRKAYEALPAVGLDGKAKPKFKPISRVPDSLVDNDLAEMAAEEMQGELCYTSELGWLHWTGKVWAPCDQLIALNRLRVFMVNVYNALAAKFAGDEDKIKEIYPLKTTKKIDYVFKLFKAQVVQEADKFDLEYDLLNVQNGVVDLRTKTLMPHHPKYLFTKITRASYIPEATHSDWTAALQAAHPDSITWLQAKFGQAITGHAASDDIVPILFGQGHNGKSAIITPVMKSLGTFCTLVPDSVLLTSRSNSQADITTLLGTRIGVIEELPEGHRLDTKRLKQVAGTETMTGRHLYKNQITWTPTHAMFITTNYQPIISETDEGSWRRVRLIDFPYRYVENASEIEDPTRDRVGIPNLRQKLTAGIDGQHEAVLAWLINGAYAWYQNDQQISRPPANVETRWREWRSTSDHLNTYLEDYIEYDPDGMIDATVLVKHFGGWMKDRQMSGWGVEIMASRMENNPSIIAHDVKKDRTRALNKLSRPRKTFGTPLDDPTGKQVTVWKGIKFQNEETDPDL